VKASDFLGLDDLRTKTVTVPRWNKAVTIRELGLEEGVKLSQMYSATDGQTVLSAEDIARVVAWGVVDENGERVFSDDDVPALARGVSLEAHGWRNRLNAYVRVRALACLSEAGAAREGRHGTDGGADGDDHEHGRALVA